ncbi:MAG: chloramphenicol phosphotransferase [Caldilineaceae bacterium]|nr:chloramphenicol phosphotransferase [Caldilineaceae bacterium]
MRVGTIIILNGASSSGKTTLVKALQQRFEEPLLDAGLDRFLWMLPGRYLNCPLWDDVLGRAVAAGETGHRLVSGMHQAIAALARSGNHVVADHVLVEPAWVNHCARVLAGLPAYLIGVHCPLPVLEAREQSRKDRTLGQARAQFPLVHAHCIYDFEVDTDRASPAACAEAIHAYVTGGRPPRALDQLAARGERGETSSAIGP